MPVVINEFEVAPAPPPSTQRGESGSASSNAQPSTPQKKEEIERVMGEQRERLARVRAY
jgi:hypothetical protein